MPDLKALARRSARRVIPPPSTWHLAAPGGPALCELAWEARLRRAPVMTGAEHAARHAAEERRHKDIEEVIACSLCGEERMQDLFHPRDRRDPPKWRYHVVRCPGCGLLYRHPGIRAERLGDLYDTGRYSSFLGGSYARERRQRYELVMGGFGPLFADGAGRRLLDFGCGTGLFLDTAHDRGFACSGVDLAADAVEVARGKPSGTDVHHGSPLDVPGIAAGGFDVVTMWSVLAHLVTPVEDLTMLRGLLGDDGVLLILTVNANSLALKRAGDAWGGFTANHLKFFGPQTLPRLLGRAGFGAVVMPPWHGDPVEAGTSDLSPRAQRRLRRAVDRGNRGNMLRAAAFVDPEGPARWGLEGQRL